MKLKKPVVDTVAKCTGKTKSETRDFCSLVEYLTIIIKLTSSTSVWLSEVRPLSPAVGEELGKNIFL